MLLHGVIVSLTAATVSFHALEVLTSPVSLSLWIILSGCAEPREKVILHTPKCKMEFTLIFPF